VLLLSRESAYQVRTSVTVAAITRTVRDIPVEVVLDEADGLPAKCVVNLDNILTIPKAILSQRITVLSDTTMALVAKGITFALDL
jgi:mRNA interferase MazF